MECQCTKCKPGTDGVEVSRELLADLALVTMTLRGMAGTLQRGEPLDYRCMGPALESAVNILEEATSHFGASEQA
jgi:hypothetical protein